MYCPLVAVCHATKSFTEHGQAPVLRQGHSCAGPAPTLEHPVAPLDQRRPGGSQITIPSRGQTRSSRRPFPPRHRQVSPPQWIPSMGYSPQGLLHAPAWGAAPQQPSQSQPPMQQGARDPAHRAAPKHRAPRPLLRAAAGREGQGAWDPSKQISNAVGSPELPGSVHAAGYADLESYQFCSKQNIFLPSPRTISNTSLKRQKTDS